MTKIKQLKENNINIFPVTHEDAVLDSNGKSIIQKLNEHIQNHPGGGSGVTKEYVDAQDNVLNSKISSLATEVKDDLLEGKKFRWKTKDEFNALSKEEQEDPTIEYHITDAEDTEAVDLALNGNVLKLKAKDGSTLGTGVTLPSGGGGSVTVENNLTSTSTTNALSAAQGKVLKDEITVLSDKMSTDYYNKSKTDELLATKRSANNQISMNDLSDNVKSAITGNATVTVGKTIQDFYNSTKGGKKIVMLGDSTVISGGNISNRLAQYQATGQCLENCTIENRGAIGKTLNGWVNNEMAGVISGSADVDMYIFCLGVNDLWNLNRTEEQISSDFKIAIDGLLENTNAYILLRVPCISYARHEWQKILRRIYMSYIGYDKRLDILDIPLNTSCETSKNLFLADDVHPTQYGYYMIADEIVSKICNKNIDFLNSGKELKFKGHILSQSGNVINVVSYNSTFTNYMDGVLYINNEPCRYTNIERIDQVTYKITLTEEYNINAGIVNILGQQSELFNISMKSNVNDWYNLYNIDGSFRGRLWLGFKIPNEFIKTNGTYKVSVSCSAMGIVGNNPSIRMTPILRNTSEADSTNQQYGSNSNVTPISYNGCSVNDYYFNATVNVISGHSYMVICLDSLNITDFSTVRIGNIGISIDDNIINESLKVVNSGNPEPKKCTNNLFMTHDSTIRLLMQLGVISSDMYKLMPTNYNVNPIPPTEDEIYGNIVLSKTVTTIVEGANDTFTVKLDKAPTNNQIVTLTKDNTDVTLDKTTLTFTPANYDTAQTVTIAVTEDNTDYSNETCIITLTSPNATTKTLTVSIIDNDTPPSNIPVQSVSLAPTTHTFKVGEKVQLVPTILPSDATNKVVSYSANNGNCTVSSNGLVEGVAEGDCVITCTTQDGNKTSTCTLTIQAKDTTPPPSDGKVVDGLILDLDALGHSGNTSTWTDATGNYGNIPLTNFAFNENDGWTGTTLKLARATSNTKSKVKKTDMVISNLDELSGLTYEFNYKCDTTRTTSSVKTPIIVIPGDIRLSESMNNIDKIYFENYSNMKVGDIVTNDINGGVRSIIVTYDIKIGKHIVYLNGLKALEGVGTINTTNLNKTLFEVKEAFGFNFEIGSIRMYNRILSEDEINQNIDYEKSLNR